MPSDGEITFADHAGRFYARRYGMAPMVGRLLGYLAVCDPREQSITELADALLASRSAIAGAVNTLESLGLIRRSRAAGERMDRVRIDMSSPRATGFDLSEYQEQGELAREGLRLLADAPPERRAILLEWAAFADFLVERLPVLEQEWKERREALRAAGELPESPGSRSRGRSAMTGPTGTPGIVARDVCKSFGSHLVLDKVNLTADEGTILALLGPNGAGKTTIVRILSTLIPADSGSMHIAGHDVVTDPDGVRALIGVTGQFSAVDNLLTGAENLRLMADLRHLGRDAGRRRVTELLEQFDLTDAADKPLSTYSGGMRRRLDLAMTLVGEPRVIFLDEPTTGLDPRSRLTMWEIVRELASSRSHHPADHPEPRRGGPAGRPDRGARPGPDRRRRNPGRAEEPDPRRARPTPLRRSRPAALGGRAAPGGCSPTRTSWSCRSPRTAPWTHSVSCSTSCTRPVSPSSGCRSTPRTSMTCSSPSPAVTSRTAPTRTPPHREQRNDDHARLHAQRLAGHAAPQPQAPAPLPVDDPDAGRHADRAPAAVRLRLRRPARCRPRRARGASRLPRLRGPGAAADHRGLRRPGHVDHGRHGHDRRHHRPVPDHGHRPRLGPHRPRARQPDPNAGRAGRPDRGRLRSRIPHAPPGRSRGWPRSGCWPCSRSR